MTPFFLWRRRSGMYYATVQLPNGKKEYHSLGTKDQQEAVILSKALVSSPLNSAPQGSLLFSELLKEKVLSEIEELQEFEDDGQARERNEKGTKRGTPRAFLQVNPAVDG